MPVFRTRRRSSGISARRVAVRPDVPWYWRLLQLAGGAAAAVALAWGLLLLGGRSNESNPQAEVGGVHEALRTQSAEVAELRAKLAQADRQLQIDRAAAADLVKQVKSLSFENAQLKEDLAFFQSLTSAGRDVNGGREGSISVNRFRLQPQPVAGEYRYQMLLVQSGQRVREFQGKLQFVLDVQQAGRRTVLLLPPDSDAETRDYRLDFRFFQRVEGSFKLEPGTVLKGLQVRVFENGSRTPKLTQALNVS
jgi:hypothetical protein